MATPTTLPATFVAGNVLTAAQMNDLRGAFRVLQLLEAQVTTDQTFTSTSFLDVTNATVTITPSATSNKVLLFGGFEAGTAAGTGMIMQFVRTSTALFEPRFTSLTAAVTGQTHLIYLDNPATTSATTYKMQARTSGATSCTINNSTFFAMEISL